VKLLVFDDSPGESVICGSGLGSSLLKLPAYEDARAAGHEVDVLTSPAKAELLVHAPVLSRCFADPEQVPWASYDRIVPFGVPPLERLRGDPRLHADPCSPERLKADYDQVSHVRFWRARLGSALPWPSAPGPARMVVEPSEPGLAWARAQLPAGQATLLVSLSALTKLKRYTRWPEVVRALREALPGARVVLVGQEAPAPELSGATDLTRQTSLEQLVALVAQSSVVVGTDGLVTNLAVACGRPTVALFTVIRPDFVVDSELELRAPVETLVHPGCPLQPCYARLGNYRTAGCPQDPTLAPDQPPQCAGFEPEAVAAAAARLAQR
jgi:glycosyl transferase family 9 (putative heptosyltransferase)